MLIVCTSFWDEIAASVLDFPCSSAVDGDALPDKAVPLRTTKHYSVLCFALPPPESK